MNHTNTLYTNDNLFILYGLNSELVDLIYLDPPFNSKRTYAAPIGSQSAGASFKDMWTWEDVNESYLDKLVENYPGLVKFIESIQVTHSTTMMAYITYMTQRLIELHRILKNTGSLYLHCDPTASHYLKIVLDQIFGKHNFRNEIIWHYQTGGASKKWYSKKHDTILYYTKSKDYHFFPHKIPFARTEKSLKRAKNATGARFDINNNSGKLPMDVWIDIQALNPMTKERTGYPTQKPLALLHRIIQANSNEGDIILDPFCGCATTCVAAQKLQRKWIGIDIETKAVDVLIDRLEKDNIDDSLRYNKNTFIHRVDIPKRTDIPEEPISISIKERLFQEQNARCKACETKFDIRHFEVDHIVPKSKGGGNYYENYQLLCSNCNRIKGNRPMEYLRTKLKAQEAIRNSIRFGG